MVTVGLLVRLAAKPGNEAKVTSFLREGCRWWNRNRQRSRGSRSALDYRHLDVPDDTARQAHVSGRAAEALDRPIRAGAG